jgi:16S rRNA (guanine1516-N2)-methyltransferase
VSTALPLASEKPGQHWDALLVDTGERLELLPQGKMAPGPIAVDFGAGGMRHRRRGGQNEPLGRAVGVGKCSPLFVVDATAGLGRDSFVLADLGCEVLMLEREPVIAALLRDGLRRASEGGDPWLTDVSSRLRLEQVDACEWLAAPADKPVDVVYLDPMFPQRHKSARVKKEMWLFQQLFSGGGSESLLQRALAQARRRVVVKRPARAMPLEDEAPAFTIPGKSVRFDVYLPPTLIDHP